ncbi:YtfJ family protein [Vibrio sp. ZSDZ34]|uniref:YtfJ family protein n=1 Tax=Vibrio gelatinilyticus TaxID=2893468 RepID=A0A9X1WDH0_9VIBR|nr:YtfJ family protein [Vibrio gelatinilyticus]MCJ2378304.1 YtfJ family protein [Vibrio gelatinilyticus]
MKMKSLLVLGLLCSPALALANNLGIGQQVNSVSVESHGELLLDNENIRYEQWNSQDMLGKVRVIQAIAGRKSAKKMNAPLMAAITEAKFPPESYQTTTIINQDDAMWGTGSFVKSSAEDSKQEFPWSSMVLDEKGIVANAWQLKEDSSAIIVQDKQGKILYIKEGALTDDEIQQVLAMIRDNL